MKEWRVCHVAERRGMSQKAKKRRGKNSEKESFPPYFSYESAVDKNKKN